MTLEMADGNGKIESSAIKKEDTQCFFVKNILISINAYSLLISPIITIPIDKNQSLKGLVQ